MSLITGMQRKCKGQRCDVCKNRIQQILGTIYGRICTEHSFGVPAQLEAYEGTSAYPHLKKIYRALAKYRGYDSFVRKKTLSRSDIFLEEAGIVVELDETQHFTAPRRIALSKYPEQLQLGFSRDRWMELCVHHDARDSDPFDRDEKRAWFDTLRDFLPMILAGSGREIKPVIRIALKDHHWCSLDPSRKTDRELFLKLIKSKRDR